MAKFYQVRQVLEALGKLAISNDKDEKPDSDAKDETDEQP